MEKRGQVTIFVIVGIVVLALVIIVFSLRSRFYIGSVSVESLDKEFLDFESEIQSCLDDTGDEIVRSMGLQGGYLDPTSGTYRMFDNIKIGYLCYSQQGKPTCMNRMLTKKNMEEQLKKKLGEAARTKCVDLEGFKKVGLDYNIGKLDIEVEIGDDSVITLIKLPIEITKGDVKASRDEFKVNIDLPLGRLYDASRDILGAETTSGFFDTSLYSVHKTGITNKPYVFKKLQPYPDKLYVLKIKDVPKPDAEFVFQFFVQGEEL